MGRDGQALSRLVEGDMAVAADAQHREIEASIGDQGFVALRLGRGIGRVAPRGVKVA
ncbi:hypothetical protein D3C86_2224520 [compost metagenome]